MRFETNNTIVKGEKTFYWEKYPARKSVIVFLHGFPGSHKGLVELGDKISGYHLIIPDLPACGVSEPLRTHHSLKNYAAWLNDFLTALSIDRVIVVGHSFGARIALQFSIDHPQKVERLVLIAPVMKVDSYVGRLAALYYKFGNLLPPYLQEVWSNNTIYRGIGHTIIYKSASRERRKHLIDMDSMDAKHIDGRIAVQVFDDFYKHPSIAGNKKINTKTLLIACDKDEIATPDSVEKLYRRFTNAEMRIMKNSGHLVILESPITVGTAISKWLLGVGTIIKK
jgi:pimeloyl-ACP methyl ester carboxylesterase